MKNIDLESLNTTLSQKINSLIDSGLSEDEALSETLSSISQIINLKFTKSGAP